MTTNDIVRRLAQKLNISQVQARVLLRYKLAQLRRALAEGGELALPGLGHLAIKSGKARRNYIPGKDAYCFIPVRKRITFKLDNRFKKIIPRETSQ